MSPTKSNSTTKHNEAATPERDYTVPAVARALELLECISNNDSLSLQELVADLGLPKTSTYQILRTLAQRGYLRQNRNGGYSLGMKLFSLGNKAISQLDIRNEATPIMYELMRQTQLTAFLAVIEGNEAMYLAKVDGPNSVATRTWVGKRFNVHTTSLGKALLAWRDMQETQRILDATNWLQNTVNSITDKQAFIEHLSEVRTRGWAMDNEENVPSIRCVAAPVLGVQGTTVAAISISGHVTQFPVEALEVNAAAVTNAAQQLSARIGFPQ